MNVPYPMEPGAHPEIGRELKIADLKPDTVVWLYKKTRNTAITMWCRGVTQGGVALFYSNITKTGLLLTPGDDGGLVDDTQTPIQVFEYLGKP